MTELSTYRPFKRVLIANRGEIAVRIIRALQEVGLESVAVYSHADRGSRHRFMADFAFNLPGTLSTETYLNFERLKYAITTSGADAVHPGYGFLSENGDFADMVREAGAVFIGPTAHSMGLLGNKIEARKLMEANGIPMVPGLKEAVTDPAVLERFVDQFGFPIILKAAAGGGGRGMRVVREKSGLADALKACRREAQDYFGNPDVFCERYLENPRHIEFQIMFDSKGHGVHLFERDCSVQRRHQKLLEEAPSHFLDAAARERIGAIAVKAGEVANYCGAGTVEFICESPEKAYFMEVNTRIQVEHPVTEMITGVDLIKAQLRVASGKPLGLKQEDIKLKGWAAEARINVEDPLKDFAPAPGTIEKLVVPDGPFVRFDTHIYNGYEVPSSYDSMIAKAICWGENRDDCLDRLKRMLREMRIEGVPTTARFHEVLLDHPDFRSGEFDTKFLEINFEQIKKDMQQVAPDESRKELAAFVAALLTQRGTSRLSVSDQPDDQWRLHGRRQSMRRG